MPRLCVNVLGKKHSKFLTDLPEFELFILVDSLAFSYTAWTWQQLGCRVLARLRVLIMGLYFWSIVRVTRLRTSDQCESMYDQFHHKYRLPSYQREGKKPQMPEKVLIKPAKKRDKPNLEKYEKLHRCVAKKRKSNNTLHLVYQNGRIVSNIHTCMDSLPHNSDLSYIIVILSNNITCRHEDLLQNKAKYFFITP